MSTVIQFPGRPAGPRLLRVGEDDARTTTIPITVKGDETAIQKGALADIHVTALYMELQRLADQAIVTARDFDRKESVANIFQAIANKVRVTLLDE